jgi:hypothetical protein
VWLPEWLADPASVVERLVGAVHAAESAVSHETREAVVEPEEVDEPGAALPQAPEVAEEDDVLWPDTLPVDAGDPTDREDEFALVRGRSTATEETPSEASVYRPWTPRVLGGIEVLDALRTSSKARALVVAAMEQIIEAEGPIHTVRLAKLTCAEFSLNKVNSQRAGSVVRLIDKQKYLVDEDAFVWPLGMDPRTWRGYRENEPEVDRKIEHVSKVEIANAMVAICRDAHGMEWEDLKRVTIRTFGGKRVTTGIGERLEDAVRDALKNGKLTSDHAGFIHAV